MRLPPRLIRGVSASSTADGLNRGSAPILATALSTNPGAVGIAAAASRSAWLVAAIPVGILLERFGPRPCLLVSAGVRLAAAALVLVAIAVGSFPVFLVALFAYSCGEVGSELAAQVGVATYSSAEALSQGNAQVYSRQVVLGQLLSPGLGSAAAVVSRFSSHLSALALVGTAYLFWRRLKDGGDKPPLIPVKPTTLLVRLRSGLLVLVSDWPLRGTIIVGFLSMFAYGSWSAAFLPLLTAPSGLALPAYWLGPSLGLVAAGALVGSAMIVRTLPFLTGFGAVVIFIGGQLGLYLPGVSTSNVLGTIAGLLLYGVGLGCWNVAVVSYRQVRIPLPQLGVASAMYRLITWGAAPLGAATAALLIGYDLQWPFVLGIVAVCLQLIALPMCVPMMKYRGKGLS